MLRLTEGLGGEYIAEQIIKRSKDKNIIYLTEDTLLNTKCVQELAKYIENLLKERQADKDRIKEKIEWLREISDNGINAVRFAATHDDEIERMQKQKDISTMIGILQELLRESD